MTLISFLRRFDVEFVVSCPEVKESSCAMCVVALKALIVELCFIHQNMEKRILFPMI